MIGEVCAYIHNYFETNPVTGQRMIYSGRFTVQDGSVSLPFLANGQYFRVFGSVFNDGVYQYPATGLKDETFTGVIWAMRPPREFLDIVEKIEAWQAKYGGSASSPYTSESVIGVYSYTKNGDGADWRGVFGEALRRWRKLS